MQNSIIPKSFFLKILILTPLATLAIAGHADSSVICPREPSYFLGQEMGLQAVAEDCARAALKYTLSCETSDEQISFADLKIDSVYMRVWDRLRLNFAGEDRPYVFAASDGAGNKFSGMIWIRFGLNEDGRGGRPLSKRCNIGCEPWSRHLSHNLKIYNSQNSLVGVFGTCGGI